MNRIHLAILLLISVTLCSCGKGNGNSVALDFSGKHQALWAAPVTGGLHPAEYMAGPARCAECHGSDLSGGISNVSCFSASRSGISCHPAGPGHGAGYAGGAQHGAKAKINLAACQGCHASPASGTNPRFNVVKNTLANGCETCHKAGTAHPTPWLIGRVGTPGNVANTTAHTSAGNLASACALCHGAAFDGVGGTAPSCMSAAIGGISCHATSPVATPAGCASCHGNPPATGKHVKHAALAGLTCATSCHNNFGPGTVSHANGTVNTALSPTYMAKPGVAAILNPNGTCSNVSCHGGQTTPPWLTGSINVNTDCTLCHASGTIQYNSYYSGEHAFHVSDAGLGCTSCHNTATLAASHFTHLETAVMEGPASATVGGGTSAVASYNPATRSCTPNDNRPFPTGLCHPTRVWP